MARWDCIDEAVLDLLGYCERQNAAVTYADLGPLLDDLAANDRKLTNLDSEMIGLRTCRLKSLNGGEELLVAIRNVATFTGDLMCVAVLHSAASTEFDAGITSDPAIQVRLNLGWLKLRQSRR